MAHTGQRSHGSCVMAHTRQLSDGSQNMIHCQLCCGASLTISKFILITVDSLDPFNNCLGLGLDPEDHCFSFGLESTALFPSLPTPRKLC